MTALFRDSAEGSRLSLRLENTALDDYGTTVISFEEQIRGWMDVLNHRRKQGDAVLAYQELDRLRRLYQRLSVWQYNSQADTIFQLLVKAGLKTGTQDLRIAAISLANDATVLTRNFRDFGKVPDLRIEDWTAG